MGTETTTKAPDLAVLKAEMRAAVFNTIAYEHLDTEERARNAVDDLMAALFPLISRYATVRMAVEVDMLARLVIADDTKDDVVGMYRARAAQLFRQAGV